MTPSSREHDATVHALIDSINWEDAILRVMEEDAQIVYGEHDDTKEGPMDWTDAWNRDKYEVGRAMHAGWKRQKIANGFADHPFQGEQENWPCDFPKCRKPSYRHHDDMIDWDALPEHQQAINFEGGREGYRMGFEAGQAVETEGAARRS